MLLATAMGDQPPGAQAGEPTPRVAGSDPRYRVAQGAPLPDFTDEDIVSMCREIGAPLDREHRHRLRERLVNAGTFYRM